MYKSGILDSFSQSWLWLFPIRSWLCYQITVTMVYRKMNRSSPYLYVVPDIGGDNKIKLTTAASVWYPHATCENLFPWSISRKCARTLNVSGGPFTSQLFAGKITYKSICNNMQDVKVGLRISFRTRRTKRILRKLGYSWKYMDTCQVKIRLGLTLSYPCCLPALALNDKIILL